MWGITVVGEDGVARRHEIVIPRRRAGVDDLQEHTHGDLADAGDCGVQGGQLAGGGDLPEDGAQGEHLTGGHGDALARVQIRRLVLKEVAEAEALLDLGHGGLSGGQDQWVARRRFTAWMSGLSSASAAGDG
jgi:hypothetical protein